MPIIEPQAFPSSLRLRHPRRARAGSVASLVAAACLVASGCGPKPPPPKPPEPAPAPEPEEAAEPEAPPAPPPKVPEDAFSIGSFNLDWAFDNFSDKRPKSAAEHTAPDQESWEWKRDRIVEVLVAERLDIVVLSELGGERELGDVVLGVRGKEGFDYQYAWVEGEDRFSGKQTAILSRFPISEERRTDAYAPIHVVGDVELPTGDVITVIGMQLKEGSNSGAVKQRLKMATSLKRRAVAEQKKHPVIIVGTVGDPTLPFDDGYAKSAAGILAGKSTKKDSDDCRDSAEERLAQDVGVSSRDPIDRIYVCGLEMRGAETSGRDLIVRGDEDPEDTPWPSVPIEEDPKRDVSDQLLVWAEVVMPKKPEPEPAEGEAAGDGKAGDEAGGGEGGGG